MPVDNYFKVFCCKRKSSELDLEWRGPSPSTIFPFDSRDNMSVQCAFNLAMREKDRLCKKHVRVEKPSHAPGEDEDFLEPRELYKIVVWKPGIPARGVWSFVDYIRNKTLVGDIRARDRFKG